MNRGQVAMKVRQNKEAHPELYCRHCLWRLTSGPCPNHATPGSAVTADPLRIARALWRKGQPHDFARDWFTHKCQCGAEPGDPIHRPALSLEHESDMERARRPR